MNLKKIKPGYFFVSGLIIRIIYFIINLIIGGHHIDEVMASLNAVSIADSLKDISGEKLPVYFDTWVIGGQSPIATYLSALTVKLFGFNLFAIRLPMLIVSVIGFFVFLKLADLLFTKEEYAFTAKALACVSPWLVFSSAYLLDCNYMAHFIVIGVYFLVKAVKEKRSVYYPLSMFFFGLCFYSYIASVLIVPFIVGSAYLILIIKKRIKISQIIISAAALIVTALPFILFGLVVLNVIPEFKLFGFSFSDMPYYERGESVALSGSGISAIILKCIEDLAVSFIMLFAVDSTALGYGLNIFQFGNLFAGVFLFAGVIKFLFSLFKAKEKKNFDFTQKLVFAASLAGITAFCLFVANPKLSVMYRYGTLTYLLIPFEAIGLFEIFKLFKKVDYKKVLAVYLCLSFILFNAEFFALYRSHTMTTEDYIYGDSLFECIDEAKDKNEKNITVYIGDERWQTKVAVYARYSFYGELPFITLEEAHEQRLNGGKTISDVTEDGSIRIADADTENTVTGDFGIVSAYDIDKMNIDGSYTVEQHGVWCTVYK